MVVARLAETTARQLKTSTPGAEPLHLPCSLPSGRGRGQRAARADAHTIHGRRSHNTNIFCKWEWETSPDLHSLILLAGDIEQNPGPPTYPCPVCHRAYSRRRGAVQCTMCQQWLCLSQHCSGISRIRHYTPGWICQGCQPPTQPLNSSIPYSPVQTTRSTQTPQRAVVHSFSSSTSFPPVHSHSPSSVQGKGGSVLGPSACQVRVDSSTPTLVPVLRPSGMSPGTSTSASPDPGPSGSPSPSGSSSPSGDGDGTEFGLPPRATLRILQWNADGIGNKKMELKALMERLDVHAVILQESKLRPSSKSPIFPNYTTVRVDRPNGDGGGVYLR